MLDWLKRVKIDMKRPKYHPVHPVLRAAPAQLKRGGVGSPEGPIDVVGHRRRLLHRQRTAHRYNFKLYLNLTLKGSF